MVRVVRPLEAPTADAPRFGSKGAAAGGGEHAGSVDGTVHRAEVSQGQFAGHALGFVRYELLTMMHSISITLTALRFGVVDDERVARGSRRRYLAVRRVVTVVK